MKNLNSSPVAKSLLTELTTFGVDDWLFIFNIEITLIMCVGLRFVQWAFVAVGLHFVLMVVTKVQPNILQVYLRFIRQAPRYVAGYCAKQSKNLRPLAHGRGDAQ